MAPITWLNPNDPLPGDGDMLIELSLGLSATPQYSEPSAHESPAAGSPSADAASLASEPESATTPEDPTSGTT